MLTALLLKDTIYWITDTTDKNIYRPYSRLFFGNSKFLDLAAQKVGVGRTENPEQLVALVVVEPKE